MSRIRRAAAAALLGGCVAALPPATAAPAAAKERAPGVERVSVATGGAQADAETSGSQISADGRVAVFESSSTTLVPGTTAGRNLYARDLAAGTTELISVATDGTQADGPSYSASVSGDGRYVVFDSEATNLVPGRPTGTTLDVYVRDRRTGRTEALLPPAATQGSSTSSPSISADGRYVAFSSARADLVPGDTNGQTDVFVVDRHDNSVRRVSVTSAGGQADGFSVGPVISADGSRVGFKSISDLEPGATASLQRPRARSFYAHDLRTGRTELAGKRLDGGPAAADGPIGLSPDGRFALYSSTSAGVVEGDTNGKADAFAKDLRTGVTRRLSLAADGSQANGGSHSGAVMSADNRRVFFTSDATNLVPGDTNGVGDAFVRDLRTGTVERLSVATGGTQADGTTYGVGIDVRGRTAVFDSAAANLVPGDTNGVTDVFVRRTG
ncbi:PD40 domain-containing protein [Streptomyces sp. ISL-11]|uniref:TolB family protein n=1 Tax=Streptomyces sp. ISL-11 TaxID=2819174 RepID=UPI001BE60B0E|nr:PD40 domain-containing protein [Streptomyces sp. ISL-11]MBT2384620.1 PD40 domain-containing protein [Streptomyces sp. ISL-11]